MDYFRLDTRKRQAGFCMLHQYPQHMGPRGQKLSQGQEVLPGEYPEDPRIYMVDGGAVPDVVGNTCGMLIVSQALRRTFTRLEVDAGLVQYLPVAIYDPLTRLASADHCIVNPIGTLDVLDPDASLVDMRRGEVVRIRKHVFSRSKLRHAPDLFRLRQRPQTYVVSERLVDLWRRMVPRPANLAIIPVGLSGRV